MGIRAYVAGVLLVCVAGVAVAGDVQLVDVEFKNTHGMEWQVRTLLNHEATSWTDFADRWRVISETGEVFGEKFLNPEMIQSGDFDRAALTLEIPQDITLVFVEAHDSKDGWAKERIKVDLSRRDGPRYRVRR